MIIQFSVRNFKTFKEKSTLSFIASNYDRTVREEENVVDCPRFNLRILKSAVLFGANASGKSKFFDALMFMSDFVEASSKETKKGQKIPVEPFRLNTSTAKESSEFEIMFLHKNEIFRYGFEVDSNKVHAEWLYHRPKTKEIEIFYREGQSFANHSRSFTKGNTLVKEDLVRPNALMLSVAAQFNDKRSGDVQEWFDSIRGLSGLNEDNYQGYTMSKTKDPKIKERIIGMMQSADLGISDIELLHIGVDSLPKDLPKKIKETIIQDILEGKKEYYADALTTHRVYNKLNNHVAEVKFSMDDEESSGTKKFFALTGPILDVLENGYILVVDELDSKLHPNMVCAIVALFNSKELNKNNAQLIFNTHDTNLLSSGLFRRDQIWFAQKDRYGAAKIYSLSDFKSSEVRSNEQFESNYLDGKYGAVPFLHGIEKVLENTI